MRIRLSKSVLANMNIQKGKTKLEIYFDKEDNVLVLKPESLQEDSFENG